MKKIILSGLVIFLGIFTSAHLLSCESSQGDKHHSTPADTLQVEEVKYIDITIAVVGDIMFHKPQVTAGYVKETDTYDFRPFFADVQPIFERTDLVLANLETTFAGSSRPYTGYPMFNSPDEAVDALKDVGIDVLTTANNHSLDTGKKGLHRTVQVLREKGVPSTGTYDEHSDSRILIQDVNGVKVAILAYTEMTNGLGEQYKKEDLDAMINMMEEEKIIADVKAAKAQNADLIIACVHWGDEYAKKPNRNQVRFAEIMTREGVDLIMGSHPHVIQESDFLEVNGNKSFVIYSMGNFISNQRIETLGANRAATETGIIVSFSIRKDLETNETTLQAVEYIPTWVYRKQEGKPAFTYRILPIAQFMNDETMDKDFQNRMKQAMDRTQPMLKEMPVAKEEEIEIEEE